MSASWCWTAWKRDTGWPNCSRVVTWAVTSSSTARARPTDEAATVSRSSPAPIMSIVPETPSDPDRHALQLRVMMQGFQALLASDAALLVAAEGGLDPARHPLVHVDLPGLEPRCDAVGAGQIAGPDAGREPVGRVVGGPDRF